MLRPDVNRRCRDYIAHILSPIYNPHLVSERIAVEFMKRILARDKADGAGYQCYGACTINAVNGVDGIIRNRGKWKFEDVNKRIAAVAEKNVVLALGGIITQVAIAIGEVEGQEERVPGGASFCRIRRKPYEFDVRNRRIACRLAGRHAGNKGCA